MKCKQVYRNHNRFKKMSRGQFLLSNNCMFIKVWIEFVWQLSRWNKPTTLSLDVTCIEVEGCLGSPVSMIIPGKMLFSWICFLSGWNCWYRAWCKFDIVWQGHPVLLLWFKTSLRTGWTLDVFYFDAHVSLIFFQQLHQLRLAVHLQSLGPEILQSNKYE